ncbi:MAG: hypothetical protein EOP47_23025 [Sphingobacteriaceae bacterium]|nr:MAG: hypothetical protein EOP47_23025 [Sphingobacteriaceae bacterium]
MRPVLISCIALLTNAQQKGMLKLIQEFETRGFKVHLWSDHKYELLRKYDIHHLIYPEQEKNKFDLYWSFIKIWWGLDKKKWFERLKCWCNNNDNSFASAELRKYMRESARVMSIINPAWFFCWNPYCCRFGIAYDAAKILDIKTVGMDWGFLPDTFILDRKGVLATSSIFGTDPLKKYSEKSLKVFSQKGGIIFEQLQEKSLSQYQQANAIIPPDFIVKSKDIVKVLVLGIGEIDAGAYPADHPERKGLLPFHESAYQQAVDIAAANEKFRVIFKPHPSHNRYTTDTRVSANLAIVNGNPDGLIDWADVVFCSGSKMEFSAIIKNKPLLTYGAGLLHGKECSYEVRSPGSMVNEVNRALSRVYDVRNKKNFITFLGYLDSDYLYNFVLNKNQVIDTLLNEDK